LIIYIRAYVSIPALNVHEDFLFALFSFDGDVSNTFYACGACPRKIKPSRG
jgi:hypothetical protein